MLVTDMVTAVEAQTFPISVNARLDVEELEDYLNVELPDGKFESVGGFVISLLGKVPSINERVSYNELEMVIEVANSRKIEKIRIRRISSDDPGSPVSEGVSY